MLGLRPDRHLRRSSGNEQETGDGPGRQSEKDPPVDLEGVVGAGHSAQEPPVEGEAARDGVARGLSGRAEVGEDHVRARVEQLAEHRGREVLNGLVGGRGRVVGVVDEVGDEGGEAPVVGAVLEEVGQGHGAVREAVLIFSIPPPP